MTTDDSDTVPKMEVKEQITDENRHDEEKNDKGFAWVVCFAR